MSPFKEESLEKGKIHLSKSLGIVLQPQVSQVGPGIRRLSGKGLMTLEQLGSVLISYPSAGCKPPALHVKSAGRYFMLTRELSLSTEPAGFPRPLNRPFPVSNAQV